MSADNEKIFEKTILDKIDLLSSYRDNIASGLKAKGLNVNVGDSLSAISFAVDSQDDEYAIKATTEQFGQVKIISSVDNAQLSTISSQISPLSSNSPYVIPAKENYSILSNLDSTKVNISGGYAKNLTINGGQLNNVDSSNASIVVGYSELKHLTPGDKAQFTGYYGTLQNLGYTQADCNTIDGKFYPSKISLVKRAIPLTTSPGNDNPVYVRILKRNSANTAWDLLYQSYNSLVISTYNQLCGNITCLMGPLYLSGFEPIDLTSNIAITFTSSLSEPFNQSNYNVPLATTVLNRNIRGGLSFNTNISSGIPVSTYNYSPILAIQGKITKNLSNIIEENTLSISNLEQTLTTKVADLTDTDESLSNSISNLNLSIATTNSNITTLSNTLADALSNALSNTLSTKTTVKVGNGLTDDPDNVDELVIRNVSPEEFANHLEVSDVLSNEIFIVSSDYLYAYDSPIKYVGDGEEATDAATVGQLSTISSTLNTEINGVKTSVTTLNGTVTNLNNTVTVLNGKVDGLTGLTDKVNNITSDIDNIETSVTNLNTSVTEITDKVDDISNEISNKTTIQLAEGLCGNYNVTSSFYIKKVSLEEYAEHLYNNPDNISSNEMFVISSDFLFGFDNKIINIKDGTEATDAASFGQLSALSVQVQELKTIVEQLQTQIAQLTATP